MNFDVEKATKTEKKFLFKTLFCLCFDWSGSILQCRRVLSLRHTTTTLNTHPKRTPHYKIRFVYKTHTYVFAHRHPKRRRRRADRRDAQNDEAFFFRETRIEAASQEAEAEADADADAEATGDDSEDASSEEEKPKDRGIFKMFAPDGEVNASDYNKFKAKMEEEKKRKQEEYAKKGKKKFLGLF